MGVQRSFRGRGGFAYINTKSFYCIIFEPQSFEFKKKMQTSEKPLETGPTFVKDIRFFQRLWTQKRTE